MSNTTEKLVIERNEAPFRIEVGFYTPDDGLDLIDVQYVQFDDRRLEPVSNDLARAILECSTDINELMTRMVPIMYAAGKIV